MDILFRIQLNRFQILHQLWVSIRKTLCKVDNIIIMLEIIRKC